MQHLEKTICSSETLPILYPLSSKEVGLTSGFSINNPALPFAPRICLPRLNFGCTNFKIFSHDFPTRGSIRCFPWDPLSLCPLTPALPQDTEAGPPPLPVPSLCDAPHCQSHMGRCGTSAEHQECISYRVLFPSLWPGIFRDTALLWSVHMTASIIWLSMPDFHPNMWPKNCHSTFHTHLISSEISAVHISCLDVDFLLPWFAFF